MHEKQLDTLRAFAVAAVFYAHFADESGWVGVLGVRVFFVVCGFLITRILIQARPEVGGRGQVLAAFYARRFLRILPIYFVTLGLMAMAFWDEVRPSLAWHALFVSNFWFAFHDDWSPWFLAHLWSLGRISYGLYLFHMSVFALVMALVNRGLAPHRIIEAGLLRLGVVGGLTILAASASWVLFERPINDLKRHFRYRADTPAPQPVSHPRPADGINVKVEGNLEA